MIQLQTKSELLVPLLDVYKESDERGYSMLVEYIYIVFHILISDVFGSITENVGARKQKLSILRFGSHFTCTSTDSLPKIVLYSSLISDKNASSKGD